jgi:hypothetical protein
MLSFLVLQMEQRMTCWQSHPPSLFVGQFFFFHILPDVKRYHKALFIRALQYIIESDKLLEISDALEVENINSQSTFNKSGAFKIFYVFLYELIIYSL